MERYQKVEGTKTGTKAGTKKRDTYKGIRISPATYDQIKAGAAADGVTMLTYIERLVARGSAGADA